MTGSSTPPEAPVDYETVPTQRSSAAQSALDRARRALAAVQVATARLDRVVAGMDERALTAPTRLAGWTRAHLVTHLARNADALVNLLTWARTGIEHPMYASKADRDADIEEGALRLAQVLREDLAAACDRLEAAAERLTGSDWQAQVAHRTGRAFPAEDIPVLRLFEVWMHLVDLDAGVGYGDIPDEHWESVLQTAVYPHVERTEGTPFRLEVELPDGRRQDWRLVVPGETDSVEVSGSAPDVLAWLTGRGDGSTLSGDAPALPPWG